MKRIIYKIDLRHELMLQNGDFEKSIDVLGHFYKWFFSHTLQNSGYIFGTMSMMCSCKQESSAPCPWCAAASKNGGQGTLALDGFIGTHGEYSIQMVLFHPYLEWWSHTTLELEGLCIAKWSSSCGLFCCDDSGRLIANCVEDAWNAFGHLLHTSCSYSKQVCFGILWHA